MPWFKPGRDGVNSIWPIPIPNPIPFDQFQWQFQLQAVNFWAIPNPILPSFDMNNSKSNSNCGIGIGLLTIPIPELTPSL